MADCLVEVLVWMLCYDSYVAENDVYMNVLYYHYYSVVVVVSYHHHVDTSEFCIFSIKIW